MKINWRYWTPLFLFVAMQAALIYSMNAKIESEAWKIKQDLSNQITCQLTGECFEK